MRDVQPPPLNDSAAPRGDSQERLRELQRLAMLGHLAGGLGHDLRNLTMPIMLRLDVLDQTGEVPSVIRSDLAAIRVSVEQLQQLASRLRLLATDPVGESEGTGTDLIRWWADVMPLLHDTLGPATQLVSQFDRALPFVAMSASALAQVIISLAMNSHRAMEGVASPVFSITATHDGNDHVRILVTDNGSGMDDVTRARCFDPFYTTSPRQFSTGLGLASARAEVMRAGGDLSLSGSGPEGTVFELNLLTHFGEDAVSSKHLTTKIALRDPRHRALTRLLLAQHGNEEWKGDATPEHHPDVVICDAEDVGVVLADRHDWEGDANTRVIAIGTRSDQGSGSGVVFISPTELSTLSNILD